MNRRIVLWSGLAAAGVGLMPLCGCDYSSSNLVDDPSMRRSASRFRFPDRKARNADGKAANGPRNAEERTAILESSITLIQRAALQPGGKNFELAVKKLNHYFEGTPPPRTSFDRRHATIWPPSCRLDAQEPREPNWNLRDTRHLEDCMMYYGIANRVAGTGEDLDRVRRVFDWVVRQVQLVPPGTLGSGQLPQVFARPYDVLLRGMATEADGFWAERAWLFMALCRQIGIDTGLITYSKSDTLELHVPRYEMGLRARDAAQACPSSGFARP